jgi:hypothetical protein
MAEGMYETLLAASILESLRAVLDRSYLSWLFCLFPGRLRKVQAETHVRRLDVF